jgi:cell division protein FtsI/penicillin-binding protein 2
MNVYQYRKNGKHKVYYFWGVLFVCVLCGLIFINFDGEEKDLFTEINKDDNTENMPMRASIYDRNGKGLALSCALKSIYVKPLELENIEDATAKLSSLLGRKQQELLSALRSERSFVWMGRKLDSVKADKINALGIKGVYLVDEFQRYYPYLNSAAHVVGFVKDELPLAGLEFYYDQLLRTTPHVNKKLNFHIRGRAENNKARVSSLVLTIDMRVQVLLERKLGFLLKNMGADAGMAMIMQPGSGEIIAMVNLPSFDPNRFWAYGEIERRNRLVKDLIFPGALSKIFQLAAVMELEEDRDLTGEIASVRLLSPRKQKIRKTNINNGTENISWNKIKKGFWLSKEIDFANIKTGVLESLDIAERVRFNRRTGIDLPGGELPAGGGEGETDEPDRTGLEESFANMTWSTTSLRLLTSFSSLINGGKLIKPHLVTALWDGTSAEPFSVDFADSEEKVFNAGVSRAIRNKIIETSVIGKGKSVFLESLISERYLRSQNLIASSDSVLSFEASGPGVKNEPGNIEKKSPRSEAVQELISGKYHTVLIGTAPVDKPELALIVILDGVSLKSAQTSPVRVTMENIIPRVLGWTRAERKWEPTSMSIKIGSLENRKWQLLKAEKKKASTKTRKILRMPDLRGMSLRRGLREIQHYGLDIQIVGSGKIINQSPGPGRDLNNVANCTIELRPDN